MPRLFNSQRDCFLYSLGAKRRAFLELQQDELAEVLVAVLMQLLEKEDALATASDDYNQDDRRLIIGVLKRLFLVSKTFNRAVREAVLAAPLPLHARFRQDGVLVFPGEEDEEEASECAMPFESVGDRACTLWRLCHLCGKPQRVGTPCEVHRRCMPHPRQITSVTSGLKTSIYVCGRVWSNQTPPCDMAVFDVTNNPRRQWTGETVVYSAHLGHLRDPPFDGRVESSWSERVAREHRIGILWTSRRRFASDALASEWNAHLAMQETLDDLAERDRRAAVNRDGIVDRMVSQVDSVLMQLQCPASGLPRTRKEVIAARDELIEEDEYSWRLGGGDWDYVRCHHPTGEVVFEMLNALSFRSARPDEWNQPNEWNHQPWAEATPFINYVRLMRLRYKLRHTKGLWKALYTPRSAVEWLLDTGTTMQKRGVELSFLSASSWIDKDRRCIHVVQLKMLVRTDSCPRLSCRVVVRESQFRSAFALGGMRPFCGMLDYAKLSLPGEYAKLSAGRCRVTTVGARTAALLLESNLMDRDATLDRLTNKGRCLAHHQTHRCCVHSHRTPTSGRVKWRLVRCSACDKGSGNAADRAEVGVRSFDAQIWYGPYWEYDADQRDKLLQTDPEALRTKHSWKTHSASSSGSDSSSDCELEMSSPDSFEGGEGGEGGELGSSSGSDSSDEPDIAELGVQ